MSHLEYNATIEWLGKDGKLTGHSCNHIPDAYPANIRQLAQIWARGGMTRQSRLAQLWHATAGPQLASLGPSPASPGPGALMLTWPTGGPDLACQRAPALAQKWPTVGPELAVSRLRAGPGG